MQWRLLSDFIEARQSLEHKPTISDFEESARNSRADNPTSKMTNSVLCSRNPSLSVIQTRIRFDGIRKIFQVGDAYGRL